MPRKKNKSTSGSANPSTDSNKLHGGAEHIVGEQSALTNVAGPHGGTNSVSPVGVVNRLNPDVFGDGPRNAENESRTASPEVAKQWARDAANVDTTNGLPSAPGNPVQHDETDPTGLAHSKHAAVTKGSTSKGLRRNKK
jgi:hypothetical protein